ncbi:DegV family protein [Nocardia stercoris]|uniref:DegV family protein n=1 Tax=Nocardia stercoris TaxID=2483361 RepID=A0A3M2L5D9_9NOCA|nr:DegV family protein [Nocardia stercoris]RMI32869.1 DegV family protein [Nocardia stercoris]
MAVVVVTDSSPNLPAAVYEERGIEVVPLHVLVDDRSLREGLDTGEIDYAASAVSTAAASPGDLRTAYERALTRSGGDGVVAVHISRQLSSTWEAGRQAIRDMDAARTVRLVDSLSAGLGHGMTVLAAARRAATGATLDMVYDTAVSTAMRARTLLVVNRTEQLRRGGRLSSAAAFFGSELVTKPVLQLVDGRLELREKARTRSKAFAKLVAAAVDAAGDDGAAIGVQHLGAPEAAETLAAQLTDLVPDIRELVTAEFGPTLGVHLGLGSVGVVVVPGGCG